MKIYVKNSQIDINVIEPKLFHTSSLITKLFTKSGIYLIDSKDNSIRKTQIIDKPIINIQNNKNNFIIDNSEFIFIKQVYQLPYQYHKELYKTHTILVNEILKIYLIIEISKNQPIEFYFYVDNKQTNDINKDNNLQNKLDNNLQNNLDNNLDNNLQNILNNISTFLSSYNFIECI
jgi:hypothetical protein